MPQGLSQTAPSEVEKARERYYAQQQGLRNAVPQDEPKEGNHILGLIKENFSRIEGLHASLDQLRLKLGVIMLPASTEKLGTSQEKFQAPLTISPIELDLLRQSEQLAYLQVELLEIIKGIRL